jgi:hypothetical protein
MPRITFHVKQGTVALALKNAKTDHPHYLSPFSISRSNLLLSPMKWAWTTATKFPSGSNRTAGSLLGGAGPCPVVDCIEAISDMCPSPLVAQNSDGRYVGCYSACDKFKDPKYCCTGNYSSPGACQPNDYSQTFKRLCKLAHTYLGDNDPPTYKCTGATRYNITFCPF